MSAKASFWAWEQDLNGPLKLTLLALANWSNDDGESWHSYNSIARACGVSRRTAINKCQELEKLGLLEIKQRKIDDKKNNSNIFKLKVRAFAACKVEMDGEPRSLGGSESPALGGESPALGGGERAAPKTKSNKTKKETKIEIPDFVDKELFNNLLKMRETEHNIKNTPLAKKKIVNRLIKFEGIQKGAANESIRRSIDNTNLWQTVYEPKGWKGVEQDTNSRPESRLLFN